LNPSEDYKASVLSGLDPELINEIAGRALSFWVYQYQFLTRSAQEQRFQIMSKKSAEDKCKELDRKAQMVIKEANQEFSSRLKLIEINDKLKSYTSEHQNTLKRLHEVTEQFNEKTRQYQKLKGLYDKLKRQVSCIKQVPLQDITQNLSSSGLKKAFSNPIPFGNHNTTKQSNLKTNNTPQRQTLSQVEESQSSRFKYFNFESQNTRGFRE
jgi:E3 ubiquitin-protein ligase CCNP1IP1